MNSGYIRFDEFELDTRRRKLSRAGVPVPMTGKAVDVLCVLAAREGVVSKDDLMRAVWPNVAVEENNLTVAVATVRRALGDSAKDSRFIVTRSRIGYEFVATRLQPVDEERIPTRAVRDNAGQRNPKAHLVATTMVAALIAIVAFGLLLSFGEKKSVTVERPLPPDVQREIVDGYNAMNRRTAASNTEAVKAFRRASRLLPGPETWDALAEAHYSEGVFQYGTRPPVLAFADAEEYTKKALAVDPDDPHALWLEAALRFHAKFDWRGADQLFKKALALNPNNAAARRTYAWMLVTTGDVRHAQEQVRLAQQLDPGSANISTVLGLLLYCDGKTRSAVERLNSTAGLQPGYFRHLIERGRIRSVARDFDGAIADLIVARGHMGEDPEILGSLGYTYARMGRDVEAHAILDQLVAQSSESYVSPFQTGLVALGLGDAASAEKAFQAALDDRSFWLPWLRCDRRLDAVGDFRRHALEHLGLAPSTSARGVVRH